MDKPAVMLLDDNPRTLSVLEGVLNRRYGQDYLIVSEPSAEAALRHLADLRAAGRPVALIMAAATMNTINAADVLAEARGVQPAAKRVLVVPRGARPHPACWFPWPWWPTGTRPHRYCER